MYRDVAGRNTVWAGHRSLCLVSSSSCRNTKNIAYLFASVCCSDGKSVSVGSLCALGWALGRDVQQAVQQQQLVESEASFNRRLWTAEEFTPNPSSLAVIADIEASAELPTGFAVNSSSLLPCGKRRMRCFLFLLPTFAGLWDLTHSKKRGAVQLPSKSINPVRLCVGGCAENAEYMNRRGSLLTQPRRCCRFYYNIVFIVWMWSMDQAPLRHGKISGAFVAIPRAVRVSCQTAFGAGLPVNLTAMQRHLGHARVWAQVQLLLRRLKNRDVSWEKGSGQVFLSVKVEFSHMSLHQVLSCLRPVIKWPVFIKLLTI